MQHLVVIGGTAAGLSAAAKAKRMLPDLKVSIIERTGFTSYGSCGLPYYVGGKIRDVQDLVSLTPDKLQNERQMAVYLHHEAVEVNRLEQTVTVVDKLTKGHKAIKYDKLVIATGASAIIPKCAGTELDGVFVLRSLEDGIALRNRADAGELGKLVIVGGGYIGLELAAELCERGIEVEIGEMQPRLLSDLPESYSEQLAEELLRRGVALRLSAGVQSVLGDKLGQVAGIALQDGGEIPCRTVVFCIGVRPNARLAVDAGLAVGIFGGICTDDSMRTSDPNIWACGDCVETVHAITGNPVYMPLGTHANKQGKVAGTTLAGGTARFAGVYGSQITKLFDLFISSTGLSMRQAQRGGYQVKSRTIKKNDHASYYPGAKECLVTLIYQPTDGRLLGAQLLGGESVAGRTNTIAAALAGRLRIQDLAAADLVYAPPVAPVYDPLIVAAEQAMKDLM